MYDFIRKKELFSWWDAGYCDKKSWFLKGIQDAFIVSQLRTSTGLRICEIGGGNSRVLRRLAPKNTCVNVDKFEGGGNGPQDIDEIPGVETVRSYMGDFDSTLEDGSFDVVFSISVLEHVPDEALGDCFADMARILKPGGRMLHAIDLYVHEKPQRVPRVEAYRRCAENPELGLQWVEPPAIGELVGFHCDFATNSDQQLANWNRVAAALRSVREVTQNCSLKMGMVKAE